MEPDEFARAVERLSSDLSNLAFEQKQERLEWRRAMEAQSAEIQQLIERQHAMQVRQDELETIAIEIEDQLQADVKELSARVQALARRIDRHDQGLEQHASLMADLKTELAGLSRTTDEVFDDIAGRVGVFERTLGEFDQTLSKQYEVLTESLMEARDQLTEGLAEAQEAAEGHADGIVELKDAIATYQERRDELDAATKEQLAAMRDALAEERTALESRQDSLEAALTSRLDAEVAGLQALVGELTSRLGRLEEAASATDRTMRERTDTERQEREALNQLVSQLAAQGQMLAQALEVVQHASIQAEEQLGSAMREQFEALLSQLQSSTAAWHASLGQTQQHFKEFEAKVAKALGLQRNENLEHERQLTALKDDLAVLTTRVGTIVQLLTKASRPSMSNLEPSA